MKNLKMALSLACLLTAALLLVIMGSHYQTSHAASGECMVCILCEGSSGHAMACCMGLDECSSVMDGLYACDGYIFDCDGDLINE
ncbi:MAG: hypothetical protein OXI05_02290 [Bacteroidota bacterium]|nr:hypothetical protein [Bacteroidota bacterium]MXW14398.1 hypothetical protein [Rhodothermaceae bacterium]MDE2644654.1 hypothetical protein [Bacteroidota bacterium]MXW32782.1 hypothetical protein [Rhodothermaceae bacterium]MYC04702.1 hypothetical protein [Rhodothermaceae bacterium]